MPLRFLIVLLLAPCLALTASAQPAPTAEAIMAAADSAIGATTTAVYHAGTSSVGTDGKEFSTDANVYIVRLDTSNEIGWKVRFDMKAGAIAYDGERALYLNHAKKTVTMLDSTSSFRQTMDGNAVGKLVNQIFRRETPFSAFAEYAEYVRYKGIAEAGGVECHLVEVKAPDTEELTDYIIRFYFGTSDYILRSSTSSAKYHGLINSSTYTFKGLQRNVPIPDSMFTIPTPEGYEFKMSQPYRPARGLAQGMAAPAWQLPDTAGKMVSLADLKGRVVVLDFWYIACPPCIRAMPKLAKLQQQFDRKDVVIIGINTIDQMEMAKKFMAAKGFDYGLLCDGQATAGAYKVDLFPTMYVIDRQGNVAYMHKGDSDDLEQALGDAIRKELAKK